MATPNEPLAEKTEKTSPVSVQPVITPSPSQSLKTSASSKFALQWSEFRKRYLTPRRVLFWVVWIGAHTGLFVYGWLQQGRDPRLAATNRIGYSVSLSRGAGICIAFDCALILLPMLRTIITTIYPAFDFLALDENIWFHRQVAYSLLFFTIIHVTAFYVNFYMIELLKIRPEDAYELLYVSWAGVTGWIMCLAMFLIYTTATVEIRVMNFEVFRYTHFLYWVFFIALLLHAAGCFVRYVPLTSLDPAVVSAANEGRAQCLGYNSWRYVIIGIILYLSSILYGLYRAWRKTKVIAVIAHPERVVEIRFEKPSLKYRSGQWLWINVPRLGRFQWHPFTITSAPSDPFCSVHIRCMGDWTNELAEHVGITDEIGRTATASSIAVPVSTDLLIHVDGPFGAPAQLVYRETAAIVVGSGIGITPWASVLKDVWSRVKNESEHRVNLKRLDLIWVCQNINQLEWFAHLLVHMQEEWQTLDPKFFHVQLYLTRVEQMDHVPETLRPDTQLCRPDWDSLIRKVRGQLEEETFLEGVSLKRVGVYLCGGYTLGKELAKTCRFYTNGQYRFRFKKEHF